MLSQVQKALHILCVTLLEEFVFCRSSSTESTYQAFRSKRGHRTQAGSDACLMEAELEDKGCRRTCTKFGNEKKATNRTTESRQYGFEMHSTERTTCEEVKDAWLPACQTGKSL